MFLFHFCCYTFNKLSSLIDSKSKSDFDSHTKHERTAAISSGFISSNILHSSNSVIKSSCDPIVAATFPFWVAKIKIDIFIFYL